VTIQFIQFKAQLPRSILSIYTNIYYPT